MKRLVMLFIIVTAVFVGTTVRAQSTGQMLADWQRAKAYTKAYLDAMPEDGYSLKPTPEMRTFAQQMLHLADGSYFLVGSATGKPGPLGKESAEKTVAQTKEATTKAVMDSYDYVISTLKGMTEAQLQEIAKVAGQDIQKGQAFNKAFEHQTHHRGQTTVYLRLKGVTPPQEMLF
ncbi:DinB family protein [Mucilaginibacter ginsenosidivorans]|uniref:Damage-inducible protein DinB n=1 Tax=Mucilaginibacter ginsenosidivorans TaxID=398053 RepID=A0A5B8UQF8_9SPHI|nr:DinB family protein [Mucilaginibacter ginsenosidivorans]QEC61254.1 damage-inducible protein DinB [Mucilaginibacter ginsenosidivorans]